MTFETYLGLVANSSESDWNVIYCDGGVPSYKEAITPYLEGLVMEIRSGKPEEWPSKTHMMVAAFKPDLSITVAWGLKLDEAPYEEDWVSKFPSKRAYLECVDLFYCNSLVERVPYVTVDGGRCLLPKPTYPTLAVKSQDIDVIRTIASLNISNANFDEYMAIAGLQGV